MAYYTQKACPRRGSNACFDLIALCFHRPRSHAASRSGETLGEGARARRRKRVFDPASGGRLVPGRTGSWCWVTVRDKTGR
jgi:hypothetical protein